MRSQLGSRLPTFSEDEIADLREARTGLDFYGQNYYTAQYARHNTSLPLPENFNGNVIESQTNSAGESIGAESGIHWLRSSPQSFRKFFSWIYNRYGIPIVVTENGCPCPGEEKMTREQSVDDGYRIEYFEGHLDAISDAVNVDGIPVMGYFAWSLFDNLGKLFIKFFWGVRANDMTWQSGRMGMV
jgi:beta-glucosidase